MGRLAELFEKKAAGSLTEAEQKEYNTLMAEAKSAAEADAGDTGSDDNDDSSDDEEVEKLAKSLADAVNKNLEANNVKFDQLVKALEARDKQEDVNKDAGFIVDKNLGKKTVEELAEIKVAIPNRQNKTVKEVSMKTVHFVTAFLTKNVEKLQLLSEGTAADGGYLVPEEFANMIIEDIRDIAVMRTVAAPAITISGDTFHLPNLQGRPKAAWRAEKAVKATSTVTFGEQVFTPYSLAVIVGLSNELVADASLGVNGSIVNYVSGLMATSLAEEEEKAFWVGTGSGQPTGVASSAYSSSIRTVDAGAGATDAKKADAIISAFQRTPQGYRNRGVWVGNSSTWEEVARLKDNNGNYLLTRLADSPTQSLRGRPVYEQNNLPGGVLYFGDYSYYQIVDREGISVRVSDEATVAGSSAFEKNLTYIRVEKRVDAELTLPAAITKVSNLGII